MIAIISCTACTLKNVRRELKCWIGNSFVLQSWRAPKIIFHEQVDVWGSSECLYMICQMETEEEKSTFWQGEIRKIPRCRGISVQFRTEWVMGNQNVLKWSEIHLYTVIISLRSFRQGSALNCTESPQERRISWISPSQNTYFSSSVSFWHIIMRHLLLP